MKPWTCAVVISSQQNRRDSALFQKNHFGAGGFALAAFLLLALIFIDYRHQYGKNLRLGLSIMTAPVQYVVDYPIRLVGDVRIMLASRQQLIQDNVRLQYQQGLLEADLQRFKILKRENSQLKALLRTASQSGMHAMAAQIMAVDTTSSRQLMVVDKGRKDGVFVGQPVLDAKGVVGQVIDVGLMSSTILLITDNKSAVPIRINRTGERGILTGSNQIDLLTLSYLPKTSSIEVGDVLVTSGLGRRYPQGYPVAVVEEITIKPGDAFASVLARPVARLNFDHMVLLIWPPKNDKKLSKTIDKQLSRAREA